MVFPLITRHLLLLIWTENVLTSSTLDDILLSKLRDRGLLALEYTTLHHDSDLLRKRDKREAISTHSPKPVQMAFTYASERYKLDLSTPQQILHPYAEILTWKNGSTLQWKDAHPDCFLTGIVTSHQGIASLSVCENVVGIVKTERFTLYLECESTDNFTHAIVGRQADDTISISFESLTENLIEHNSRSRRSVLSHNITIELAVYTDAAYTQTMLVTEFSQRLQHILLKYHAVQMEWSRSDMLGFNVQLLLKKVQFFETNPTWYNSSTSRLGNVLYDFCLGTLNSGSYDIRYMHVGLLDLDVTGRAYQNSVCDHRYSCGVDTSTGAASFAATAHEIGHLMGMYHDADRGCSGNDVGLMGGYGTGWSNCSKDDMASLLNSANKECLWKENVPLDEVPQNIVNQSLVPATPGQRYSPDQVCELKYGVGYRFRKYPKLGVCVLFSCANHNLLQVNYGQMFKEHTSIFGMYCAKNKICFKMDCVDASSAKLSSLVERQGGWSQWGAWTGCSRTCARGVNYRRRKCDNPAPINFEGCEGDAYEAVICNTKPCPNDSTDQTILRNQRAGETCKRLRDNNVIKPDLYMETGSRYSHTADGQCEVTCDPTPGHTIPSFTRFGFMPDGVACVGGTSTWDLNNWPRQTGSYYMCLDGLCQRFGCDDRLNGKVLDECGVCGGDNSSCTVISGTDIKQQNQGERRTIAILPNGTFNIQFWFSYRDMKQNFLELYNRNGDVILASRIPSSWKWDTRTNPVEFANTTWYYFFHDQFLNAKGPLSESCEIKLYQHDEFNNTGVHYAYSEPQIGFSTTTPPTESSTDLHVSTLETSTNRLLTTDITDLSSEDTSTSPVTSETVSLETTEGTTGFNRTYTSRTTSTPSIETSTQETTSSPTTESEKGSSITKHTVTTDSATNTTVSVTSSHTEITTDDTGSSSSDLSTRTPLPSTVTSAVTTEAKSDSSSASSSTSTTPLKTSTVGTTTLDTTPDEFSELRIIGIITGGVSIVCVALIAIAIGCNRNGSWCKPNGKHREIYRVSGHFDGSSKPLSRDSYRDYNDI
ncbi:A disintegrin and metalloproteinase with thrombospondin motifs 5-like [Saccostrea echinata]|uniref:A disintegrin and metalloproteinase with thrombospondin motifs 5-like n=1 Tax=Saccostrea echinata TaxID=191078 RepID=UPI002A7EC0CE|nr:A disintegrin and metalloproteinase with thrombospondin motifs 5-like [Saccostrea echinata]